MADNYIERKMAEHRARQGAAPSRALSPAARPRQGEVAMKLGVGCVFVAAGDDSLTEAIVSKLRSAGCRTAFMPLDAGRGRSFACSSGARCYPPSMSPAAVAADLAGVWRGSYALFVADSITAEAFAALDVRVTHLLPHSDRTLPPAAVADRCAWLCLEETIRHNIQSQYKP